MGSCLVHIVIIPCGTFCRAAIEHAEKICDSRYIKAAKIKFRQTIALQEHITHIAYAGGIEMGEIYTA